MTVRTLARRAAVVSAVAMVLLLSTERALAQALPHAALMDAYRRSVTYVASELSRSSRKGTIDASVTAVAVHRALTDAINLDMARLKAASRRVELGETALIAQVDAAEVERASHLLFVGNWIGDANEDSRLQALDGTAKAITDTETALAAMAPLLARAASVALPPALLIDVTARATGGGSFVLLADVRNVGGEAAERTALVLRNGDSLGGASEEVTLGTLVPGASARHVFGVALAPGQLFGSATVGVRAANASTELAAVDVAP